MASDDRPQTAHQRIALTIADAMFLRSPRDLAGRHDVPLEVTSDIVEDWIDGILNQDLFDPLIERGAVKLAGYRDELSSFELVDMGGMVPVYTFEAEPDEH